MSHKITKVNIKNYRSFCDADLKLSQFTPLIGYNNAGKSNALSALKWLLRKSSLHEDDFHDLNGSVVVTAEIEGVTGDILNRMPERQRTSIEPLVFNERITISRLQEEPNARSTDIKIFVWNEDAGCWTVNPNGIENSIKALLPEPIRIGAMENAAEDAAKAKNTTTIGKLLSEFLQPVREAHEEELNKYLGEVSRRISSDGDLRLSELETIDGSVNAKINDLFPGMSIKLHFDTPTMDDLIKAGTIKLYEENSDGRDFSSYGHGAQRAIQMALVQHLAEIKQGTGSDGTTTLLLIDEPETYLHPFAIEQVREALISLSENGYQVLLSTHSAQMVTPEHAEKALLIRKDEQQGTYSRTRMTDAIHNIVPNANHQIEQLFSLSHSTQVLFAESVVLTEGKTELRLLPFIYEQIKNRTMGQEKKALVAQTGVNDTKKSLEVLAAMDLPSKVIADLDYGLNGAIKDGFLDEQDPDIHALRNVLQRLSQEERITLNGVGLPKNGIVSAAKAFEILSEQNDAFPSIERIHDKMKEQGVWLWKRGAIEAHINVASKDELGWARFKKETLEFGLEATCHDYHAVRDLVWWLES